MDLLPSEILIEIFTYLEFEDFISLSVTCKRFSQIIANSQRIMKNFLLRISDKNSSDLKLLSRKYSNVRMNIRNLKDFYKILHSFTDAIKILVVINLCIGDLKKLLFRCVNLKELTLGGIELNGIEPEDICVEPLPILNLEELKILRNFDALELFKKCTVKKVIIQYLFHIDDEDCVIPNMKFCFNGSIEEFMFEDCTIYEETLKKLFTQIEKLKVLRFIETEIDEECEKILEDYKEKYDRLEVENDYDDYCDYERSTDYYDSDCYFNEDD